jgi:hypothetical protein
MTLHSLYRSIVAIIERLYVLECDVYTLKAKKIKKHKKDK